MLGEMLKDSAQNTPLPRALTCDPVLGPTCEDGLPPGPGPKIKFQWSHVGCTWSLGCDGSTVMSWCVYSQAVKAERMVRAGECSGEAWPRPGAGSGLQEACMVSTGVSYLARGELEAWEEGRLTAPVPKETLPRSGKVWGGGHLSAMKGHALLGWELQREGQPHF